MTTFKLRRRSNRGPLEVDAGEGWMDWKDARIPGPVRTWLDGNNPTSSNAFPERPYNIGVNPTKIIVEIDVAYGANNGLDQKAWITENHADYFPLSDRPDFISLDHTGLEVDPTDDSFRIFRFLGWADEVNPVRQTYKLADDTEISITLTDEGVIVDQHNSAGECLGTWAATATELAESFIH